MRIKDVRVVIAGAGNWGKNHVKTISAITNNWKVVEPNTDRCDELHIMDRKINVQAKDDWDSFDAVIIAAPSPIHFDLVKLYWGKGKHVLCEKPVVKNKEELHELVQMVKSKPNQVFMAGHTLMYHPAFLNAIGWLNNHTDGHKLNIILRRMKENPIVGDDEIYRLMPHDLSVLDRLGMLGGMAELCGKCGMFAIKNGSKANVVVSWHTDPPIRDFYATTGAHAIRFNDYEERLMYDDLVMQYSRTPPLMREHLAFLSTITGYDQNHSDIEHTERVYTCLTNLKKWEPYEV